MGLEEFLDGIGTPSEVRAELGNITVSNQETELLWLEFEKSPEGFYQIIKEKRHYRLWFLKLYLLFAWQRYPDYKKKGISDEIYFDTFHDIINWVDNCIRDYNETGLEEYDWIRLHLQMKLFKIGRLQYEMVQAGEQTFLNKRVLEAGEMALNLHIPQGEPLDLEQCRDSLKAAGEFFYHNFKEITCHSWLLSPVLKEIADKDSNIVKFQSLFTIYDFDQESREGEERTFENRLQNNPRLYPEKTSLQRAMKEYLCKGGRIGSGYGLVTGV